jgi:hypothetical protein
MAIRVHTLPTPSFQLICNYFELFIFDTKLFHNGYETFATKKDWSSHQHRVTEWNEELTRSGQLELIHAKRKSSNKSSINAVPNRFFKLNLFLSSSMKSEERYSR